jgi:hypothetical protein
MSFDLDKLKTVSVGRRTRDHVTEGRTPDGGRYKAVTDELNNTVTERTDGVTGVSEHQDVTLRPETVHQKIGVGR